MRFSFIGDTFDILALINNSVNFILYCLMSRAFRDTFKETFCFTYHKFVHGESTTSVPQLSITKTRQHHLNSSVTYEHVSTNKCSDDRRASITTMENKHQMNKTSLQISNNSATIPLLNEKKLNGLTIKNSSSS